jgi:hypothetical protein
MVRLECRRQAQLLLMFLALKEELAIQANVDRLIAAPRAQYVGAPAAEIAASRKIDRP